MTGSKISIIGSSTFPETKIESEIELNSSLDYVWMEAMARIDGSFYREFLAECLKTSINVTKPLKSRQAVVVEVVSGKLNSYIQFQVWRDINA